MLVDTHMTKIKIHAETPLTHNKCTVCQYSVQHPHCGYAVLKQANWSRHYNLLVWIATIQPRGNSKENRVYVFISKVSEGCRVCEQEGQRHVNVFVSSIKHLIHLKYSSPHLYRD